MNAHIGHDLELAVVEICSAEHAHPLAGSIPADYCRITDVLVDIEPRIRQSLLDLEPLTQPLEPLLHLTRWSIVRARQAAWVRAQVLWELRATPLFDQIVAVSASTVGMTNRHPLTPLLRGPL